ncbi:DUF3048 domain-containing protein [Paenibacillus sp. GCM10012307]|uniref:DUF3048 domain-containing protein n=3 Tax=Paenibacillus TaxID=44249 RepID=A0A934MNM7_9BACL|nr:DUF3048 domain-containing protein [Paenibacillus roseus]
MQWNRKSCSLLLLMMTMILLSACGGEKELRSEPNNKGDVGEIIDPVTPVSEPEQGFKAPFTGLKLEEKTEARPIAVMVNNYKAARPQSGLTNADIIWEVLAEGGITRLVAIFQSYEGTERIGPIRSIRPYLIEMGEMYKAVLVHAGASNDGYAILQQQRKEHLDEISNAGPFFWREKFRKPPHNLYSNLEKMREGAQQKKYTEQVQIPSMTFVAEGEVPPATAAGVKAEEIDLYFSLKNYHVSYTYDANTKLYSRFINKEPHIDLDNEQQLTASNLVVLGTRHRTLDDVGRLSVDLTGGGPAMLFQEGKMVEAEWVRSSADDIIRIMKDGQELPFVPGKTYYHLVPLTPSFEDHVTIG